MFNFLENTRIFLKKRELLAQDVIEVCVNTPAYAGTRSGMCNVAFNREQSWESVAFFRKSVSFHVCCSFDQEFDAVVCLLDI